LLGVSTKTYGAEFDRTAIETFINGTGNCPSRDCVGHGTHVAGTAAGNGNPGEGIPPTIRKGTYDFAGVAPEADIVVVKYLDTGDAIIDTGLNFVTDRQQFRDAIYYVLKVAKKEGKAAVINCSFGHTLGPHDGLTEEEQFLDALFSPGSEFFNGNVVVIAAGNEAGSRAHAQIIVPASGEITIPYTLYDVRGTSDLQDFEECRKVDSTRTLFIDIWYKTIPGPDVVSAQVKVPGDTVFSNKLFHGELRKTFDRNKKRNLEHKQEPAVNRPLAGGGTTPVRRSRIRLRVEPSITTNPFQHKTGLYELKITAPPGTVLHTWVYQHGRLGFFVGTFTWLTHSAPSAAKKLVVRHIAGFKVNDIVDIELDDGTKHTTKITKITVREPDKDELEIETGLPSVSSPKKTITGVLPSGLTVEDKFLISSNGGAKNVITVASYDDVTDPTRDTAFRNISSFSSRGPLVDYSGLGQYADKPEIAAPGALIKAAKSRHYDGLALNLSELLGNRFVEFRGTSMAAPHIAGLIALMLQKKKTLNVNDIKTIFTSAANDQDGLKPVPTDGVVYREAFGGGIADGKKAIDAIT
jgi:subtilisin family serine protease